MSIEAEQRTKVLHQPAPSPARRSPRRAVVWLGGLLATCITATVIAGALRSPALEEQAPEATTSTDTTEAARADPATRSPQGAVVAASEALEQLGSVDVYQAGARRALLQRFVVPNAVEELDAAFGRAAANLGLDADGRSPDGPLVARVVPVGSRVQAYSADEAVVSIWNVGLLGVAGLGSRNPVQESWSTDTITLIWTQTGWRWSSSSHSDGPVPVSSAQVPSSPDDLAAASHDFAALPVGAR